MTNVDSSFAQDGNITYPFDLNAEVSITSLLLFVCACVCVLKWHKFLLTKLNQNLIAVFFTVSANSENSQKITM